MEFLIYLKKKVHTTTSLSDLRTHSLLLPRLTKSLTKQWYTKIGTVIIDSQNMLLVGFLVSLVHPCICLLHDIYYAPASPILAL